MSTTATAHAQAPAKSSSSEILSLGAMELAERIRARELSPVEVVEAHIRRIEEVNPTLNALVAERFEAARQEARQAEQALYRGAQLPPLHGVPFTVKEMINLEGMPVTFGSLGRKDYVADQDATAVRRLRDAGAIPLGVTNVPEWGFWFETDNLIYGRTRNPYDPGCTCGGSSGGEAAIIGAGGSPFGVGSDIGGSIRMPAAFCGVFGHKPTAGLVPLTGHYPVYASGPDAEVEKYNPYVVVGPLARSARDLFPLLRIMAGPDGVDPNAEPLELGSIEEVEWSGRRVLVLDDPDIALTTRTTPEVRGAVVWAARALEERGAAVEPLPADTFHDAVELWTAALRSMGEGTLLETAGIDGTRGLLAEWLHTLAHRPQHSLPLLLLGIGELLPVPERRTRRLLADLRQLAARLSRLLGKQGILLMPPHPCVAPRHGRPLLRPFDFAYTAILNVLRLPVTVAPLWQSGGGLPIAIQIAAARGNDHLTIAAAMLLEERYGVPSPALTP